MLNFETIRKDIKEGRLKFFGSSKLFDKYDPININEIIAITIQNYAEYICDTYEIINEDANFRTSGSDLNLSEVLKDHVETTGFYINFYGPNETRIMVEIAFPNLNEYESFEEYIKDIQKLFINDATYMLNDFDADNKFDEIYQPNPYIKPSELIEYLKLDETYFKELSEKLEVEYKNLEKYYKNR